MNPEVLQKIGFGFGKGTVHSARTIMLDELTMLLEEVPAAQNKSDYIQAIIERNCLCKQSFNTRKRTAEHLTELYTLDPQVNLFRNLLYFWRREEQARPLLAMLCAATRDGMLRETADRILKLAEGAKPALTDMEETIETLYPGRFSARSVTSRSISIWPMPASLPLRSASWVWCSSSADSVSRFRLCLSTSGQLIPIRVLLHQ